MKEKIRAWFVSVLTEAFTFAFRAMNDHAYDVNEKQIEANGLREAAEVYQRRMRRAAFINKPLEANDVCEWLYRRADRIDPPRKKVAS